MQNWLFKNTVEKTEELQDSVEVFKRNIVNKTGVKQQDFDFRKNIDVEGVSLSTRTKKGLSINVEDLNQDHIKILKKCQPEKTAATLMKILGRTNKSKFKDSILSPLVECGFLELTIPEKPTSPKQKYRPTGKFVDVNMQN